MLNQENFVSKAKEESPKSNLISVLKSLGLDSAEEVEALTVNDLLEASNRVRQDTSH